ncbi:maleylpyruvate isomerase family mycothiol-dependent enzyme [Tsukamurella spumae]|uniref:Maleylpyruvate isomerase family mycothiol-dependent enzyme n=1 Tax=Tsukamurella spumae TaxID=44753 RepID=A0A846X353_9ACTN|nr:maleylpyruvate isomerase family mycothiol-dependent enzyme [Tsukamurella spumae]NKY19583.1 maleylpyruvate isomerase family mycothiol-dependent enzyme [Tsukamurella spumae]
MSGPHVTTFRDLPRTERLRLTAQGTTHFEDALAELTDDELRAPSLLPGWSRRHLVGHVGHNGAALLRLLDWAETGIPTPMYASPEQRNAEIEESADWEPHRLRSLVTDTADRLDRRWRGLEPRAWAAEVTTAQGRTVPAEETLWMRAREVWVHAVDLGSGSGFSDIPEPVLTGLLADITGKWRTTGTPVDLVLEVDGATPVTVESGTEGAPVTVAGPLHAIVRWAAGRGADGLRAGGDTAPPRWL